MAEEPSSPDKDKPAFFCHLCDITCLSAFNLQSHFLGIKHRKAEEAERRKTGELEPKTEFFCHLCGISCASALNLQSHFLGAKHRKAEMALKTEPAEPEPEEKEEEEEEEEEPLKVKAFTTLQEQIDACQNSEPAVGLEYIYQALKENGYYKYQCKLCECQFGLTHMFMHIIGARHRTNYLGKHNPKLRVSGSCIPTRPKKLKKLKDVCLKVEKELGRQQINIVDISEIPDFPDPDAPSVVYTPESELEQLDFTNDDLFEGDGKPATSERPVTFLELKAIHEANQKKARELSDRQNLLEFLERFQVLEDGHVNFVVSVVEKLSLALSRHKKVSEERKSLASKSDGANNDGSRETRNSAPTSPHAKQDPEPPSKDELSSVSKLSKTEMEPVTSSESTPTASQDAERQPKKMGIPESSQKVAIGERKKLMFTVALSQKAQALRNPVGAAPRPSRAAPPAPPRLPAPPAVVPPKVAPPLFPIAQDGALTKFFDSIKNMEVPEVMSTLNAITATNPAFKGIHVPSLIRYLGQTGKLKVTPRMQQPNP